MLNLSTERDPAEGVSSPPRRAHLLGLLPFVGTILFVINAIPIITGDASDWRRQLVETGVHYLVGWSMVGAAVAHLFFSRRTSASIGWRQSPFEREVGFADLGMGVAGLLALSQPAPFWLAVIIASGIFRFGCGIGHVRSMIADRNFAVNNTAILFNNFVVPAFLLATYYAWVA